MWEHPGTDSTATSRQDCTRPCPTQVKLRSTPRSRSMTASSEAVAPAEEAADSTDHAEQAPSGGHGRVDDAAGGTDEDPAPRGAVAAGWAAVDTWGGARTKSGRFARSPEKATVSSVDDAIGTAGTAVVAATAISSAAPTHAKMGQTKAIVPPLWQSSVQPAEMTAAVGTPTVDSEARRANGGEDNAASAATGRRAPTVDGWIARPGRSRPAEARPMIPRVATLAPGPDPAARASVVAQRSGQQPIRQQLRSTARPASGSVAKSPKPAPPPDFPGFASPARPTAPHAAAQTATRPMSQSPPCPAGQRPPPAVRSAAAAVSAANGAPLAAVRPAHTAGSAAATSGPDPAAKFGYVYAPPPAPPRPPRGLPRSPVRGMSSVDASGLRPVATMPVRANFCFFL